MSGVKSLRIAFTWSSFLLNSAWSNYRLCGTRHPVLELKNRKREYELRQTQRFQHEAYTGDVKRLGFNRDTMDDRQASVTAT